MIISGAYGRDYKSQRAVLADWLAGKDFTVRDLDARGAYVNRADYEQSRERTRAIQVRYQSDRKVMMLMPVFDGCTCTGWRF